MKKNTIRDFMSFLAGGVCYSLTHVGAIFTTFKYRDNDLSFLEQVRKEARLEYRKFMGGWTTNEEVESLIREERGGFFADASLLIALLAAFNLGGDKLPEPGEPLDPPAVTAPAENKVAIYFRVGNGDNLTKIARAAGVGTSDIKGLVEGRTIWPGDIIYMDVYKEQVEQILAGQESDGLNGTFYLKEATYGKVYWYVVGKGDYLEKIASAFGVTADFILECDLTIGDPNRIYPGQIITVYSTKKIDEIKGLNGKTFDTREEAENYVPTQETKPTEPNDVSILEPVELPDGCEKGIDMSRFTDVSDWNELEAAYKDGQFEYIILRMATNTFNYDTNKYEFQPDLKFEERLIECNNRKIPISVYVEVRGVTPEEVREQALAVINYINDLEKRGIEVGLVLPLTGNYLEPAFMAQTDLYNHHEYELMAELMITWCETVKEKGHLPGIYCSYLKYIEIYNNCSEQTRSRLDETVLGWFPHYGNVSPTGHINTIGYNGKVPLGDNIYSQQVAEYGKVAGVKTTKSKQGVDVNISLIQARVDTYNFYTGLYGLDYYPDYYKVNAEPSLRGSQIGTQIRFAPCRQERRHPGTTYEGVTSSLVSACMDKSQGEAVAYKSVDAAFRGSKVKYTNGKRSLARFKGMSNKAIRTGTF